MNEIQIKEYIESYNVIQILQNSFMSIIENNSCEDLDIKSKNVSIDINDVEYDSRKNPLIIFKTKINYNGKAIGYYSLVFEKDGKVEDDIFVIF